MPKVKKIFANRPLQGKEWDYLAIALLEYDNWKLESIPALSDEVTNVSTYFNCAYHVRNSLKNLDLARRMIGKGDFGRVAEFKQLTKLRVDEFVLRTCTTAATSYNIYLF